MVFFPAPPPTHASKHTSHLTLPTLLCSLGDPWGEQVAEDDKVLDTLTHCPPLSRRS